jgi:hypothetical protein
MIEGWRGQTQDHLCDKDGLERDRKAGTIRKEDVEAQPLKPKSGLRAGFAMMAEPKGHGIERLSQWQLPTVEQRSTTR